MKYLSLFCTIWCAMFVVLNIVWNQPALVVMSLVLMAWNMYAYYLNDRK